MFLANNPLNTQNLVPVVPAAIYFCLSLLLCVCSPSLPWQLLQDLGHPYRTYVFRVIPQASVLHVTAQDRGLASCLVTAPFLTRQQHLPVCSRRQLARPLGVHQHGPPTDCQKSSPCLLSFLPGIPHRFAQSLGECLTLPACSAFSSLNLEREELPRTEKELSLREVEAESSSPSFGLLGAASCLTLSKTSA